MNILYHHRTQGKGGEGVHIRETIKALESIGHRVTVISPPGIDVFEENELDSKASSNSTYSVIAKRSKALTKL